jgi:hypothetical protein
LSKRVAKKVHQLPEPKRPRQLASELGEIGQHLLLTVAYSYGAILAGRAIAQIPEPVVRASLYLVDGVTMGTYVLKRLSVFVIKAMDFGFNCYYRYLWHKQRIARLQKGELDAEEN